MLKLTFDQQHLHQCSVCNPALEILDEGHQSSSLEDFWDPENKYSFHSLGGVLEECKGISTGAQYMTLQKYFSHPSLIMYSFATARIKMKLGRLIANHMDELL